MLKEIVKPCKLVVLAGLVLLSCQSFAENVNAVENSTTGQANAKDKQEILNLIDQYYPDGVVNNGAGFVNALTGEPLEPISSGSSQGQFNSGNPNDFGAQWCGTLSGSLNGTWYGTHSDWTAKSNTKYCGTSTAFVVDNLYIELTDNKWFAPTKSANNVSSLTLSDTWTGRVNLLSYSCDPWWKIWCYVAEPAPHEAWSYHRATNDGISWSVNLHVNTL